LPKVADFNLPHLHLASPLGVTPLKFSTDLWRQKTSVLCYRDGQTHDDG